MKINGKEYDSIVVTLKKSKNPQLVTADDKSEVIAIIHDNEIICKNRYEVKLVPADDLA